MIGLALLTLSLRFPALTARLPTEDSLLIQEVARSWEEIQSLLLQVLRNSNLVPDRLTYILILGSSEQF